MRRRKINAKELRKMIVTQFKKGYKTIFNSIEIKNYEIVDRFLPGTFAEVPIGAMMHISFINCVFNGDVQITGDFKNPISITCKDCHFKSLVNFSSISKEKSISVEFSSTIIEERLHIGGFVRRIALWGISTPTIKINVNEESSDQVELSFGKIQFATIHVDTLATKNVRIIWCHESSLPLVKAILPNTAIENFKKDDCLMDKIYDFKR